MVCKWQKTPSKMDVAPWAKHWIKIELDGILWSSMEFNGIQCCSIIFVGIRRNSLGCVGSTNLVLNGIQLYLMVFIRKCRDLFVFDGILW